MAKIKTINNISEVGTDILKERGYSVSAEIENPDGIIIRSANILDFEPNDNLLAIARAGAGYNNIPVERCTKDGIVVFNSPGANAEAVKELVMCELILASRDVLGSIEWVKSISDMGDEIPALVEKGKSSFAGPELMGKTLGVIGLGIIPASQREETDGTFPDQFSPLGTVEQLTGDIKEISRTDGDGIVVI